MEKVLPLNSTDLPLVRPEISKTEIKKITFNIYGLKIKEISELNGYDDRNFHILVDSEVNNNIYIDKVIECGYVLKIINSIDSQNDTAFEAQTTLLLYLAKQNVPCPKPILTKDQKPFTKIDLTTGNHIVRLLEFISGDILYKVPWTPNLFYDVGKLAAKLDIALQNFSNTEAYQIKIKWSLDSAPDILEYIHAVKSLNRQMIVKDIISEFSLRVLALRDSLEKGLIHGDMNEQNILVENKNGKFSVKAIIDFGDTHYSCYLYELAIAVTYMVFVSCDIDSGGYVLAGYFSVRNISEHEFQLLRICVLARFCQSLVLGAYAHLKDPDNTYILTTAHKGWDILEEMVKIPEKILLERWKATASSMADL